MSQSPIEHRLALRQSEIEKLKAKIDRLNNYVISGHQIIEKEMKAEIEKLKAENAYLIFFLVIAMTPLLIDEYLNKKKDK